MTEAELAKKALEVAMHTDAMLAYWDKDLICRFANAAYSKWFGVKPEDMIDKMTIVELLGEDLYNRNKVFIENALNGKCQIFERLITTPDGSTKSSRATYKPDIIDNFVNGFYVHVADVTPLDIPDAVTRNSKGKNVLLANADLLDKIVHVLKANILSSFPGIEQLAKKHFISESKLKRDFKERFGQTVFSYFRNLQMDLAHKYLQEKSYNKSQIAFLLNFANPSNFSDCYRRYLNERQAKEKEIAVRNQINESYKVFVSQAPVSLAMLDTTFRFVAVSENWRSDHLRFEKLEGKKLLEAMPCLPFSEKLFYECLEGMPASCDSVFHEKVDGSPGWLRWDIRSWHNSEGDVGGLLIFTQDITELRLKLEENRIIGQLFQKTNELSRVGTWTRSIRTGKAYYSNELRNILEVSDDYKPKDTIPFDFIHFTSRDLLTKAMEKAITWGEYFEMDVHLETAKGQVKLVQLACYPEHYNGKCERIVGVMREIISDTNVLKS